MKLAESMIVALRALTVNRMRTALTMLGIIIGVGAVIALVSAGQGAQKTVSDQIGAMGSNIVLITPASNRTVLGIEDADFIQKRVPSLVRAMPVIQVNAETSWKSNARSVQVQGVDEGLPEIRSFWPESGRFVLGADVDQRRKVAVLGRTVVDEIFQGKDPIGERLSVLGQSFTVVGVMEEKGESFGVDNDNVVFVPVSTLQRLAGTTRVSAIYGQVADPNDAEDAVNKIRSAFDTKFRRGDTVNVASQKQLLDTVSTITTTFTVLLASIAGISLLVGGIGIMNIMLVSVTERTREIGIRKAVGAKNRDVMFQFLIESSILSGIGGSLGILLGASATRILARFGGWSPYISASSVILALGFSVGVGMFFGLYPAFRAAKLDPIYCLRYE